MEFRNLINSEDYVEFGTAVGRSVLYKTPKRCIAVLCIFTLCFSISYLPFIRFGSTALMRDALCYASLFGMFVSLIMLLNIFVVRQNYSNMSGSVPLKSGIRIDEKGVSSWMEDGSTNAFYAWSCIQRVLVSENLIIFSTNKGIGVMLPRRDIPQNFDVASFVTTHMQGKNITEVKTNLKRKLPFPVHQGEAPSQQG